MRKLYIANSNFEFELMEKSVFPIVASLKKHPLCLQLQFLPLFFADESDAVLVTDLPSVEYLNHLKKKGFRLPSLLTYNQQIPPHLEITSWGWSRSLASWASENKLAYKMPAWEVIKLVNSKAWSFENSPKLRRAGLALNESDLTQLLKQLKRPVVLKTCFGLSGRGHLLIKEEGSQITDKVRHFCQSQWSENLPIIVEPWVERVADFSSQWFISQEGRVTFLAITKMINSSTGSYQGTILGKELELFPSHLPLLEAHKIEAEKILLKMHSQGYFGYAGIDAMIYKDIDSQKETLHPIVEVNARMTMAMVMLWTKNKYFPDQKIHCDFVRAQNDGLLPPFLNSKENIKVKFNRQLQITILQ